MHRLESLHSSSASNAGTEEKSEMWTVLHYLQWHLLLYPDISPPEDFPIVNFCINE